MNTEEEFEATPESNLTEGTPSVTFESITFSDGTTIHLDPADVVVLVGPNNSGKSLALRELDNHFGRNPATTVLKSANLRKFGEPEGFDAFVREHGKVRGEGGERTISGYQFSVNFAGRNLRDYWPDDITPFRSLFFLRVPTEKRITDSDPVPSINNLEQHATNPIHMLWDDELESKISGYFRRAFEEDLILYRGGVMRPPLLVGERPAPQDGEDRVSSNYLQRLIDSTVPLNEQGDGMRSFASVILHLLAPITPTVMILDEPEAFLHPPQARLLGEIIANERSSDAQLFVATHSSDVLHGLINVASDRLRVLRVHREGNVNRVKELDKDLVREISVDPLMKYSSVMAGVFHERVIICESDADCMFYSSILDLPGVRGEAQPDVLFVHASGKGRIAALAKTLVALGVPVDVITDIDILRDTSDFKSIVEALDQDSTVVSGLAEAVKSAIEHHKPWLNAAETKKGILETLEDTPASGEFPQKQRSEIESLFRKASPWDAVKSSGESAIPSGGATQQFQRLLTLCKAMGLWIVPAGELEGFCKSVGGHGPRWVQQVIEDRDLAKDQELERARVFVRDIWASRDERAT
ncbi:MAG: ATP-binding protein [Chloroflexi bacterium]|nr:ATP-binding protein [Chloroflexota bacterium]